jgi:hypothetical protein
MSATMLVERLESRTTKAKEEFDEKPNDMAWQRGRSDSNLFVGTGCPHRREPICNGAVAAGRQ